MAGSDPYTAVQTIDHLSVIFCALSGRPLGDYVAEDTATGGRVIIPRSPVRRLSGDHVRVDPPLRIPGADRVPGPASVVEPLCADGR